MNDLASSGKMICQVSESRSGPNILKYLEFQAPELKELQVL
jgi:hypothetical protein